MSLGKFLTQTKLERERPCQSTEIDWAQLGDLFFNAEFFLLQVDFGFENMITRGVYVAHEAQLKDMKKLSWRNGASQIPSPATI